jgi:hypothetical protein
MTQFDQLNTYTDQLVVVLVVLMPDPIPHTQKALLVFLFAVIVKLIISIECTITESTHRVALE